MISSAIASLLLRFLIRGASRKCPDSQSLSDLDQLKRHPKTLRKPRVEVERGRGSHLQ